MPAVGKTAGPGSAALSNGEAQDPPPAAIPVADIALQAETAFSYLRQVDADSRVFGTAEEVESDLAKLIQAAAIRRAEMRRLLTRNAALDTIRSMAGEWRDIETRAAALTRDLTRQATQLDRHLNRLDRLGATWQATAAGAVSAAAPAEVVQRVKEINAEIARSRNMVLRHRADVLGLQSRAAALDAQATEARKLLAAASERATARLLHADSAPLWSPDFLISGQNRVDGDARDEFTSQWATLVQYLHSNRGTLVFHAIFLLSLIGVLHLARRRVRARCEMDGDLRRAAKIFDMPVLSALLIALIASMWLYERPPRLFWSLVGMLSAIPTLLFARRVIEPHLHPVLFGLIGFYLADKLRLIVGPVPVAGRILFLAQAIAAAAFIVWLLGQPRRQHEEPFWAASTSWRVARGGAKAALALTLAAAVANAAGFVRLSELIGGASLGSAYLAVVLYSLARVGDGLLRAVLHMSPIATAGIVMRHRSSAARTISRWIRIAALGLWAALTLRAIGLLDSTLEWLEQAWQSTISLGSLSVTIGSLATFGFVIWGAVLLSRLVRFLLTEEVYPKLHMDRGLPYAVSRIVHYAILVTGIVLALGAIGVDMTKFTILAGALTVGIGFGLQNIVNNFVSGLIVLFERPVKVGDTIQLDDITGRVERIGIRASMVHSATGADVIIPNGKLISDKLINWTFSDRYRQITVPVVAKPDIDVGWLTCELLRLAQSHPAVLEHPVPEVLFTKRALDVFEFELRVWSDKPDQWMKVRSELIAATDLALRTPSPAASASDTQDAGTEAVRSPVDTASATLPTAFSHAVRRRRRKRVQNR